MDARVELLDADVRLRLRDGTMPLVDGDLPAECWSGTSVPCACPGGAEGFLLCEMRAWTICECPAPIADAGPAAPLDGSLANADGGVRACTGDPEWCDGHDNDCDGIVDEHHACPDASIRGASAFSGTLYLNLLRDGRCELEPLSPRDDPVLPGGPPTHGCSDVSFRPARGAPLWRTGGVVHEWHPSGVPTELATPPCFDSVGGIGFDGLDRFYYACDSSLRRGAGIGEIVGEVAAGHYLAGVFASGRTLLGRWGDDPAWAIGETDGALRAEVPVADFTGTLTRVPRFGSVFGDQALVVYRRSYRGRTRHELVVFRADGPSGTWSVLRRVPYDGRAVRDALAFPDGRLFWEVQESGTSRYWVFEAPLAAPVRALWRDSTHLEATDRSVGLAVRITPSF